MPDEQAQTAESPDVPSEIPTGASDALETAPRSESPKPTTEDSHGHLTKYKDNFMAGTAKVKTGTAKVKTGAQRVQAKVAAAAGKYKKKIAGDKVRVDLTVIRGRNLVAKDRDGFGLGDAVSSDPYIKVIVGGVSVGKTEVVFESLNPKFKVNHFHFFFEPDVYNPMLEGRNPGGGLVRLRIYDRDQMSSDDNMGTVIIPMDLREPPSTRWYPVTPGSGKRYCKNASGDVEVKIEVTLPNALREALDKEGHEEEGHAEEGHAEDSDDEEDNVEVVLSAKGDSDVL